MSATLEEKQADSNDLLARFQALERSEATLTDQVEEANRILRWNQREGTPGSRDVRAQQPSSHRSVAESLLRWLLKKFNGLQQSQQSSETRHSLWRLLADLIDVAPNSGATQLLSTVDVLDMMRQELEHVKSCHMNVNADKQSTDETEAMVQSLDPQQDGNSKGLKRKREKHVHEPPHKRRGSFEQQTEHVNQWNQDSALLLAIGSVLKRIQRSTSGKPGEPAAPGQRSLQDYISIASETASELLGLVCELAQFFTDAALRSRAKDTPSIREMLGPFLNIWVTKISAGWDADSEASTHFQRRCLKPGLDVMSWLRTNETSWKLSELDETIKHYALGPARKGIIAADHNDEEEAIRKLLDQQLSTVTTNLQSNYQPKANLQASPRYESTPSGILFGLALESLPATGTPRHDVEAQWLRYLFMYLSRYHLQPQLASQISLSDVSQHSALKELVWLCLRSKLKLPRAKIQEIVRHVIPDGTDGRAKSVDWAMATDCILLDPYWVLVATDQSQEGQLFDLLLALARTTRSSNEKKAKRAAIGVTTNPPDEYEAAVSRFALSLVDIYVGARKLSSIIKLWERELILARQASAAAAEPALCIWEDSRVAAAVSSHVEPSLIRDQLLSTLEDLQRGLQACVDSSADESARIFSVALVLSSVLSGLVNDPTISEVTEICMAIHASASALILSEELDLASERQLWGVETRLLERWPEVVLNEEQTKTRMLLCKRATKMCKRALKPSEKSSKDQAATEAFGFLWRLFEAGLSQPAYPADELSSGNLLKMFARAMDSSNEHAGSMDGAHNLREVAVPFLRSVVDKPRPLYLSKFKELQAFFSAFLDAAVADIEVTRNSELGSTESVTQEASYWTMWRWMISSEEIQREQTFLKAIRKAELEVAERLLGDIDGQSAELIICKVAHLLEGSLSENWGQEAREKLVNLLLEKLISDTELSQPQLGQLSNLALCLAGRVLKESHPTRAALQTLLEKHEQGRDGPKRLKGLNRHPKPETGALIFSLRSILNGRAKVPADLKLKEYIKELNGIKAMQASTTTQAFAERFKSANQEEQIDCVRSLIRSSKREEHGSALVFMLQICKTHFKGEDKTSELKASLAELISGLLATAARSKNPRSAVLALRCIALAFLHNPWAVGQSHIDEALALVELSATAARRPAQVDETRASTATPAQQRSALDLGSARRMLFGSLGIRAPKTQTDLERLRQQSRPNASADTPDLDRADGKDQLGQQTPSPLPADSKIAPALYKSMCSVLASALQCHRVKLNLRWELVLCSLQALLAALFEPHAAAGDGSTAGPKAWLTSAELPASSVTELSRLLESICDPTPSSVRPSKKRQGRQTELNDVTKKARSIAGRHMSALLKDYCRLRLQGQLDEGKRAALSPGLYAVLDAMSKDVAEDLNDMLSRAERDIFRGVMGEYKAAHKWQGR